MWFDLAHLWISAAPTAGNAPCAKTCDPDSSELLRRFRNAVHHQKLHDKTGPTRVWHFHGMRHLARPLRIGYSSHSQRSGAMYSGGARRRGSAHVPIKAFMDDTTLITNRKQVMQRAIKKKVNDLPGWCRMEFKPAKFRSLALTRGKLRENVFFVADQRIHTVSEEHVKSLRRIFDADLSDKKQEEAVKKAVQGKDGCNRQSPVARKIQGTNIAVRAAKTPVASHHLWDRSSLRGVTGEEHQS